MHIQNLAKNLRRLMVLTLLMSATAVFAQTTGWTQIDIYKQGTNPGSKWSNATRSTTFTIQVKNKDGNWEEVTINHDLEKGKTYYEMAEALGEKLKALQTDGKYQFWYWVTENGVTIWPINYDNDDTPEGEPKKYPDDNDNKPTLRKESHPVKKKEASDAEPVNREQTVNDGGNQ